MSKELFIPNDPKSKALDDFSLKADSRHAPVGVWARQMDEAHKSGDKRAWMKAALCRLRRMRGLCAPAEGFDCVITLSSPLSPDQNESFRFLSIGYNDLELGNAKGISLLWEDARGERHWLPLDDIRQENLKPLYSELETFFSAME